MNTGIDGDSEGTDTGSPDEYPKELAAVTVEEAQIDDIREHRAGMEQIRKARPLWTLVAGIVPLALLGYLVYFLFARNGIESDSVVLLAFTIATFSSFIVIYSVLLNGLYRVSRPDALQGQLMGATRHALGKGQDPSP